ncbi:hypothetical protein LOC71_18785, partial [Rhodopirellula sp. JC740]
TFPGRYGDLNFNIKLDYVFRAVNDRLSRYDTAEACGKWNEELANDFRRDSDFIQAADDLFTAIVRRHTHGDSITSDGLYLNAVDIQLGVSLILQFRLNFLDASKGYSVAPARFSVAANTSREEYRATICCGLREPVGNFWYSPDNRITNASVADDHDWAVSQTRIYGPPTIASWIDRRCVKGGEQSDAPESPSR